MTACEGLFAVYSRKSTLIGVGKLAEYYSFLLKKPVAEGELSVGDLVNPYITRLCFSVLMGFAKWWCPSGASFIFWEGL